MLSSGLIFFTALAVANTVELLTAYTDSVL